MTTSITGLDRMERDELLATFREMAARREADLDDPEVDHMKADEMLLAYIGDTEITEAFRALTRWYS